MTIHPDVETLSTYLDRELGRRQRSRVAEHLERCEDCRVRLSSLQKVVGNLRALERLAPPAHLGTHLHRLASLESSQPSLIQRLERSVSRFSLQPSVTPIFAIVVALILIIYMLSWGLHRQATGGIPVHLEPETARDGSARMEPRREVAGRSFSRRDGIWVEEDLDGDTVVETMASSDPRVRTWMAATPELQEISTLGGHVRLRMGDRVVEIRFDSP